MLIYLVIIQEGDKVCDLGRCAAGVDLTQNPVQTRTLADVSCLSYHLGPRHVEDAVHRQLTHQLHLGWRPAAMQTLLSAPVAKTQAASTVHM